MVATITNVDYTLEDYNRFEKSLVTIARSVKSEHNGGKHGYAGVILRTAAYHKLLGSTTETFVAHPKPPRTAVYDPATATPAVISKAKEDHLADREQYYTQEGVIDALKYLILTNVPKEALVEIEDSDTEFENVTPLEMMNHLRTNARVTDVFDKKQLLNELNTPIIFDGDLPLKGHFKHVDAQIKLLKKHNVDVSESIIMVTLLEQIKAHGDFKEEVSKWELKPLASQTWVEFKQHFAAADHERRQRDQYGAKTAKTIGATVNHVTTVTDLKAYVDNNLLALAHATSASINAAVNVTTTPTQSTNKATGTENGELLAAIKAIQNEIKQLKGANNGGSNKGGNTGATKTPRVKCKHCNRYHPKVPDDKCWALPGNATGKPDGWEPRTEKTKQD